MIAVLKHELKHYFRSLTAYVFGAFLLLMIGFGSMIYQLQAAISNFEYVLSFASIAFVVIVPILTMRVLAEERKQKTDQLLYSLPISTTDVILGKYMALLIVYLIPLLMVCLYPLIFSLFGDVYLFTSYGSMIAFFVLGAALIAVGMFLSSLTDNQGFAAGMTIALILFNYYSVSIAETISSTSFGSAIVLAIVSLLVGILIKHMTKSENLGYGISCVMILAVFGTMLFDSSLLEGFVPSLISQLSLFERFYVFVNGVFDWTGIVYYVSVASFFLFLSVQSMEKRRYN